LARKFGGQLNIDQRLVPLLEQVFGEFKPPRADIVMRRSADRDLERAGKMDGSGMRLWGIRCSALVGDQARFLPLVLSHKR
jgi:hypothetical protein